MFRLRTVNRIEIPRSLRPLARDGIVVLLAASAAIGCEEVGAADILRGRDLYAQHCANCHGKTGVAVMPGAPSFARGENLMKPDLLLLSQIRAGRGVMPGYQGVMPDRDILNVIAFMRTFQ